MFVEDDVVQGFDELGHFEEVELVHLQLVGLFEFSLLGEGVVVDDDLLAGVQTI